MKRFKPGDSVIFQGKKGVVVYEGWHDGEATRYVVNVQGYLYSVLDWKLRPYLKDIKEKPAVSGGDAA